MSVVDKSAIDGSLIEGSTVEDSTAYDWQPSRRIVLKSSGSLFLFSASGFSAQKERSVLIQAGRRPDTPDAEVARFPPANVDVVRERIKASFVQNRPLALVTAAACGTDLLALEVAGNMNVQRFILLPSAPAVFRQSSVIDRPGDWGTLFDESVKTSHLEVLTLPEGQAGYLETNLRLLDRGQALARKYKVPAKALVVWNQKSRGADDVTEHFLKQAQLRHLPVIQLSTL